ncbi:hypothetical protein ABZ078_30570 [Streptomyces sp. NPDC006385]|uniref:hypothetical protein n=1 Tax=Streptomyces sp. NPDC006385 TaxID=3156761 RepID=UPI0033BDBC4F
MTNLLAAAGGGLASGGTLLVLCLVACPLIMGVMMWFSRRRDGGSQQTPTGQPGRTKAESAKQAELVRLEAEIDQLRAAENDARRVPKWSR